MKKEVWNDQAFFLNTVYDPPGSFSFIQAESMNIESFWMLSLIHHQKSHNFMQYLTDLESGKAVTGAQLVQHLQYFIPLPMFL